MIHGAIKTVAAASGLLLCSIALAQLPAQSLPATAITGVGTAQAPATTATATQGNPTIQWNGHLLTVSADGQHLSEVLRDVATRANIRVTGTTPDDRIFGTYGPAPLVDVLASLVDGLPVNMLFVEHTGQKPSDLTFTDRIGGVTPASDTPQQSEAPRFAQQPSQQQIPQQSPAQQPSYSPPTQAPAGADTATGEPNGGTGTNPASPNGVKTPQEIFEQLQRLRANAGTER